MKVDAIELRRVRLPLVSPWRTASSVETERDVLLVRVAGRCDDVPVEGWGECGALSSPGYSPEFVDGAHDVVRRFLAPLVLGQEHTATELDGRFAAVAGHPMAKSALATAVLDAELRASSTSLASFLGAARDRVPAGVAVGITEPIERLLEVVGSYVGDGYARVKLKIEPGRDLKVVEAVRERFPGFALQVDANAAYTAHDLDTLVALDPFDLLLVEQPFAADDLLLHAELARRVRTPVCLDESIVSAASAQVAIALGACSVVNIKAARVGGYLEARRVHDVCAAAEVPVWCGGMLETGIGRAANLALAALPGFTLPGDLSASRRYYERDLTEPFVLEAGTVRVPEGPGIGVTPLPDALAEFTTSVELLDARL
jgi:o-succinylbenzoate synthase